MNKPFVTIYTDGSCKGNPGKGGWAAILYYGDKSRELYGSEAVTTNNRMEMLAVINALEAITKMCPIRIYTDSQYVSYGIQKWLPAWRRQNFHKKDGSAVKNVDLWQRLDSINSKFNNADIHIDWQWVRGHDGNDGNERADFLASQAASMQIQNL